MTDASDLTLSVSTHIEASPAEVWAVMTGRLEEWWCPRPWRVELVALDWKPGGRCAMTMHGPAGEVMPNEGVFLEVMPGRRFITTDAFTTGWVPAGPFMVGIWAIEPDGAGTRYTGAARHWTQDACEQHRAMGFAEGWGTVAAQLKALCEAD